MFITTIQLLQMVVGIIVTVASVLYHMRGEVCHTSLFNSALGLVMYTSYFVLFLQLFLKNYFFNKKRRDSKELADIADAADAASCRRLERAPRRSAFWHFQPAALPHSPCRRFRSVRGAAAGAEGAHRGFIHLAQVALALFALAD